MERREYSETMTALDGDSDFRRQLKPSALLRYVEQVSAGIFLISEHCFFPCRGK